MNKSEPQSLFSSFLDNGKSFLKGMAIYANPNLLSAFNGQASATGGNGTVNNTGTSAAQVANATNAMDGASRMATSGAGLGDSWSSVDWTQFGTEMAPHLIAALGTGLGAGSSGGKAEEQPIRWVGGSARLPSYVLGR